MNTTDSALAKVAVSFLPGLNTMSALPLIERCGGLTGFFSETKRGLAAVCREFHVPTELFDRQAAMEKARVEMEAVCKHDIHVCCVEDFAFPPLLKECEDTPLTLYYKGELETEDVPYLAIVGTRNASEYYKTRVQRMLQEMADKKHRIVVVSGLAYGIDITAHLASLQHRFRTYAVLGHGLHTIYPAAHRQIAERIVADGGALISEFPTTSHSVPANFLQRNRIIAGLSQAILVAESAIKGGAMTTARIAVSYNRDVLAIPGKPTDTYSQGCNFLIKRNMAALAEDGEDLIHALGLKDIPAIPVQTSLPLFEAGDNESVVLNLLRTRGTQNIEELCRELSLPAADLNVMLLKLELDGHILALPGKSYMIA